MSFQIPALHFVGLIILLLCLPVSAQITTAASNLYWEDIPHWEHAKGTLTKTTIKNTDWDAVSLQPNAMVTYRIPHSAFTRIFSEEKELSEKINFSSGDGNGLFTELTRIKKIHSPEKTNNNLLLMPENNYWQLLVHNISDKPIILSVMTSRASEEKPFPQARKLITPTHKIDNQTQWLATPHLSQHDLFAYNSGDSKTSYSIKGPAFIEVESILLAAGIDEALPSYLITSELDGELWQQWQHQAALYPFIRHSDMLKKNDDDTTELMRSTYAEKYFLQIPAGTHTLSFNSLRPIALRIFESQSWGLSSNEDFLYPNLKQQQQQQLDDQSAKNNLTETLLTSPTAAITQILNQWKDKQHPITASQERSVNRSQFYRALTATTSGAALRLFNVKPVVAKYTSIQRHPDIQDRRSINSAEDTQTDSVFTELVAEEPLTFSLPDRSGPSNLRVRLAGLNHQPAKYLITFNQGQSHTLFYYPKFRSTLLDASNNNIEKNEVSIAEAFIPLSAEIKSITIKTLFGETSQLQLSYLAGKRLKLQPDEILQTLRRLDTETDNSIIRFLQGKYVSPAHISNKHSNLTIKHKIKNSSANKQAQADYHLLQSSLSDLAQRIQIRSQQFLKTTLHTDTPLTSQMVVPKKWQQSLQGLVAENEWAGAIDIVSPLSRHQDINIRNAAAKLQGDILFAAGEFFLYEHWLLKVLNSPAYADLSRYAESTLIERYKKLEHWGALERLSAYRFVQTADIAYLELMAECLSSESSLSLKQTITLIHTVLSAKKITVQPALAERENLWQPLQTAKFTAASSVLLHGQDLDNYSTRYTASPTQALEFTIEGPTILSISYRTLLDKGESQSSYSWLTLQDNKQAHYIPTFQSSLSNGVSIIGADRQVSGEQSIEYHLDTGRHQIHLSPEQGELVIGLSTRASTNNNSIQETVGVDEDSTLAMLSQNEINTELNTLPKIKRFKQQQTDIHPVKSLLQLIWAVEHPTQHSSPQSVQSTLPLITLGNALLQQHPSSPLLNRLEQRLNQPAGWQLEQQLIDSAGKRLITFDKAPESNPKTRIRQRLIGPVVESSQWLSAQSDLSFNINSATPVALELQLKQPSLLNGYTEGASIKISLNEQRYRTISLVANEPFKTLRLDLKAGNHQLRIAMADAKSDQQVLFRALRKTSNNQWQFINMPAKQAYAVSLKDNPVTVFAAASEWLRIDDLINGQVHRSYHYQDENGVLALLPRTGQSERLLRIYKLRLKPYLIDLASSSPPSDVAENTFYPFTPTAKSWQLTDNLELGEENEGTWGGYLKLSNQASSDDTADDISASMTAIQLGHTYRKKLSDAHYWTNTTGDWQSKTYWKSDTFVRSTNNSSETLGTDQKLILADPETDWQLSLNGKIQYFQASNSLSDDVLNVYTDAQYRHDWQLNRRQSFDASLTAFSRYLDDKSPSAPNDIDPLVYSDYIRDHTYGLRIAGNWRYRLRLDSRWNIGTQLHSNESLASSDQLSLQTGYLHYFKGLTATLSLRHVQRFKDDDRRKDSRQNEVKGSLRFHQWNSKGNEWFLRLNLVHNITLSESALALTFGFNESDGRGIQDYLPTELPMRDLYQQQNTQQQTMNSLTDQSSL